MRWVKKTRVKRFRLTFSTGSPTRKTQSKKVESKKLFFDCVRKPNLGFSRKKPFSTDESDWIRIGTFDKSDCVRIGTFDKSDCKDWHARPFLTQSDLSVENGLFRLKPNRAFLRSRKTSFCTKHFCTDLLDWQIQSKKRAVRLDLPVELFN